MMVNEAVFPWGDGIGGEVPEKDFHDKSGLKAVSAISCGFFLFQEMLCLLLFFFKAGKKKDLSWWWIALSFVDRIPTWRIILGLVSS